jgi:GDP-L-fucose synthase
MCRSYNRQYGSSFLAAMPTNLYGPNDNFDLETSHVLPALIRKFHEAKLNDSENVVIWGSGSPYREFLHVDDLAEACLFLMNLPEDVYSSLLTLHSSPALINIGSGEELCIRDLARLIRDVVGFKGGLAFDAARPDGAPRKLTDVTRIHSLGWRHRITLEEGLGETYRWYLGRLDSESRGCE